MSQYSSLQYAKVIAPSCEIPTDINTPLNLPLNINTRATFDYDFSTEKEAIKIAKESIKTEAESKQQQEDYEERKKKRTAEKDEENRLAMEALALKQTEDKAAAVVRQKEQLAQKQAQEQQNKEAEKEAKATQLAGATSRPKDDQQQVSSNQRERELIQQFQQWTGATDEECNHYLSAYDWKLDKAVQAFFGRGSGGGGGGGGGGGAGQ